MNTSQVEKLTGIPAELLVRMRSRTTSTIQSGPPYCKTVDEDGRTIFVYDRVQVRQWMKIRNCIITAGEAASLLGMTREEIMGLTGIKRFDLKRGSVIVQTSRNLYLFVMKRKWKRRNPQKQ